MLISTVRHGDLEDSGLQKMTGTLDNENESSSWVEYWLGGSVTCWHRTNGTGDLLCHSPRSDGSPCGAEMVHRSARVDHKKPMVFGNGATFIFGEQKE
jgi:hypothetical protein